MKKLLKISALIAAMALSCAFFGCSNGNSSDDNNSNSGGSTTISFDDCTATATGVTLSDGNWTLKITQSDDGMSSETNIKATASNGSYTFKSGSGTMAVDLSKMLPQEKLTEFNALSPDEKKQEIIEMMKCPEDATITFNGNIVTIKASLSTEALQDFKSVCDFSYLPSEAIIKTNSDKTKYTITLSIDEGKGTAVFYISKD